ncbi:ABC transporter ATP-binding protein [Arthrobacter bambusae]|uniref:ABC transporter ATP-binding protein n=1 Tax=Arthrobacter bambusae TaxID=1338426 RepID=UPI002782E1DD|nr:ABC transporter ATP-binding protein [Arthrobacter bambusae]MDQ0028688.1 ABC-2 type transport system ATP-binding protein [Arthrobacter bambusae]MDQ0096518.1 ABC-2 type transport system ATP-binding protein [Arthrobacter bambusae]
MDTVIQTVDLHKNFGRVKALDGLDLEVHEGEIHGFLGPNGAGKTTTLRILLGLARASSGSASVLGKHPWTDAVELHRRVASVPGDVSIWPNLSGGEAIDLLSRLRGGEVEEAAYKERKHHLCELFDFDPSKKGRAYSKGNRQKVALIAALVIDAELYLLDEPTSGLDPLMEAVFTREIRRMVNENGATVLLSSHILSEVEQLAGRVSIIRAGRIVDGGTLDALRHLTRTEISFAQDSVGTQALAALSQIHDLAVAEGRIKFSADSDRVHEVLPLLGRLGVKGLLIAPPSLEELFLRHYGDTVAAATAQAADDGGAHHRRHRTAAAGA